MTEVYRAAEIYLISESTVAHGVHEEVTETQRMVYATVSSLSQREREQAQSLGLTPEIVFVIRLQDDYQGEKRLLWNSVEYHVSFYTTTGDMLRLTAERVNHDGSV